MFWRSIHPSFQWIACRKCEWGYFTVLKGLTTEPCGIWRGKSSFYYSALNTFYHFPVSTEWCHIFISFPRKTRKWVWCMFTYCVFHIIHFLHVYVAYNGFQLNDIWRKSQEVIKNYDYCFITEFARINYFKNMLFLIIKFLQKVNNVGV